MISRKVLCFHVLCCFILLFAEVEEQYTGPRLDNGKVTLKFMEELMEFYKDQKKLHRKFAYQVSYN